MTVAHEVEQYLGRKESLLAEVDGLLQDHSRFREALGPILREDKSADEDVSSINLNRARKGVIMEARAIVKFSGKDLHGLWWRP